MKKLLNFVLLISLLITNFFVYINDVYATTVTIATVNDTEGVNLRNGPGTNYNTTGFISYPNSVNLVNNEKYPDKSTNVNNKCNDGWYQVSYNGSTNNYICSTYVNITTKEINNVITNNNNLYYTSSSWGTRVDESYDTVRNSPNGSQIDIIYLGTNLNVISTSGNWSQIEYYNGRTGWVRSDYISNYNNVTATDIEYNKTLKEAGFPESYWPFLTYLHKKYPNWIFKANKINKDFNTVINNEIGKNYIQTNESNYRLSNTIKENPNWYAASTPVVSFFLDPRNYLTEKEIFAFQELTYDKTTQTSAIVKNIFNSSYLANDTYVNYFMNAANSYNINPVYLASRVKQEGGTNESYAAVSGKATTNNSLKYNGKSLDGFYNYYNIGAYQDSITSSPVTRGIAVAAGYVDSYEGTPWNTREKAILYGAKWIAEGYISKKQNTVYFQKFNTQDNSYWSSYTHQYMTNIIAPAGESLYVYYSYQNQNLLNSSFTFNIPVYNNTPTSYTAHPTIGDTNNDLASISINDTNIVGFDNDVISYEYYIPKNTTKVTVNATAVKSTSSITGGGEISTDNNETNVSIIVTSQVGTTKTYNVKLIKSDTNEDTSTTVNDILSHVDVKLNNTYMSGLSVNTTTITLANGIKKIAPTAAITITDVNKNTKSGILKTGDNITITNGNDSKAYTIIIKGDTNGDGIINSLDLLRVQKHILNYSKLSNAFKEACDVNYDGVINSLDLLKVQKHILGYTKLK